MTLRARYEEINDMDVVPHRPPIPLPPLTPVYEPVPTPTLAPEEGLELKEPIPVL